jgi:hypothetical protein
MVGVVHRHPEHLARSSHWRGVECLADPAGAVNAGWLAGSAKTANTASAGAAMMVLAGNVSTVMS